MDFIIGYLVPFLLVLTILVFVHEMGHFWVARRNGVRVETFSIGFGPELFGWTDSKGTRWKFSAILLGGYVKMFGEQDLDQNQDAAPMTEEEKGVSFRHKRLGQRSLIVAGGPAANFLFAILILAALFLAVGTPEYKAAVGRVQAGSAADVANFQTGDLITHIGAEQISRFEDLRRIVSASPGMELTFSIIRDGADLTLTAIPEEVIQDESVGPVGLLGVSPDAQQLSFKRHNPFTATWLAIEYSAGLTVRILSAVGQIISGSREAEELGGVLRIAQISGEVAQDGWVNLVFFMAALSINLGLINLFPIPVLDGGHLLFYAIEAIRGRPLDQRYQEYSFRFGLILVLLLVIFVTWNDLVHLRVFEFFK